MNSRSGVFLFFLFLFLSVIVLLQVLSMKQSDRLYDRINRLDDSLKNISVSSPPKISASDHPAGFSNELPGDEGDWLVWSLGAEPATLNPIITLSDMSTRWIAEGNIFESLLEIDLDTLDLRPMLAEKYSVSEDGMTLYFTLRDGICFSDGKPLTADDVVFTFHTIKNPNVDAASLANYFNDLQEVIQLSDREIQVTLKQKYFKSLSTFGGMPILPKHIYAFKDPAEFNKHHSPPIGTGPYLFERWEVGRKVVLQRNERYWRRKPKLRKVVFPFILNDAAAMQAFRAGEVDFIRPLPEQFADLSADKEFSSQFQCLSYWTPMDGYFYIAWNEDKPFFADRRVRLAMTSLINREQICKNLLKGDAQVPSGPFYIHGKQTNPDIKPWPYDPKRAVQLLDEAGWIDHDGDGIRDKDGVPFRFKYMIVSGTSLHEQIAKLVKDSAAKLGIDVIPDPFEWSIFIDRLQNRQFDATNLAWFGAVEADPYQIWHSSQIGNKGSNYVGFSNPQADALIEEARRTMDEKQRNPLYHKFHEILHHEQPYTFVYTRPSQRFLHPRFKNVIIHKLGLDPLEWYVPKEMQKYK